jgi:hypothetical protein
LGKSETKWMGVESNREMLSRSGRVLLAVGLLVGLWRLDLIRTSGSNRGGPVRILRFYASVGAVKAGEAAQLCYVVENARKVSISPILAALSQSVPAEKRCLEIVPEHTTHYTLMAEGYDGTVAARSITLAVERVPVAAPPARQYALRRRMTTRAHRPANS